MNYEAVIGLEVHVQIKTKTKLFSPSRYEYGAEPNTLTDEIVLGLPGSLPVINFEAIKKTLKAGLIFECTIPDLCKWDRKNYFYPDNPKNYQISQYDNPICSGGFVEIELPGPARNLMGQHKKIALNRIQLEEDVGKLTHGPNHSEVDFNRAGVALMEIVSEPCMATAEEAFAYLTSLKMHLFYAGISDCDMEKGQLRCDANVSLRPVGAKHLGTKVELKNLNSISGVRNGLDYEIKRQRHMLESGKTIKQETRKWNAEESISYSMRAKETVDDYRYFPDPDLLPIKIERELIDEIKIEIPELPFPKQERFFDEYKLPYTLTSVFYPHRELCDYFEAAVREHNNPNTIANFIVNDILRELSAVNSQNQMSITECKISPTNLANLVKLIDNKTISKQIAKEVLVEMFNTGQDALHIITNKGLTNSLDDSMLKKICGDIILSNPKPVNEYKNGKLTAINALKGLVMKETEGKANPQKIDYILKTLLD
ncbi:MAG: Asp-tRNA(Asn)/Glu-tRNA(Gln) amidotransferase subunit GatB [Puniceicoccales bacterium]|jgi:aspartyl-tRNA(Asn)/glutamyl-tRNA(Gln) amidotransferase subunit B|nr:Asp-tRNA(Asn)/Glu-tRNA(Gln) amidotransferase subunit GatB [Puniceicoccales bacterium]